VVDAARQGRLGQRLTSNAAPTIQALVADSRSATACASTSGEPRRSSAAAPGGGKESQPLEFDAVSVSGLEIEALYREACCRNPLALHADMLEGTLPAHRGWAPQFINVFVQAYNTPRTQADLPKRWTDLLDPRWRGKLGAEAASGEWYCTVVKSVNAELLRTIAARNVSRCIPATRCSPHGDLGRSVARAVGVYPFVYEAKDRGAPIDA